MVLRPRLALSLVLVCVSVVALAPAPAPASFKGKNGLIALSPGFSKIRVARSDGSNQRTIVKNGHNPSFSPEGRRIAFAKDSGIFLVRAGGGNVTHVRHTERGESPAYSGSRKKIFYVHDRKGPYNHGLGNIYSIHTDGSHRSRLTDFSRANASSPTFSVAANRVVFSRGCEITSMRPDGSGLRAITEYRDDTDSCDLAPNVSPDGKHIVFQTGVGSGSDSIQVVGIDGRNERQLAGTAKNTHFFDPIYSPTGTKIAYARERTGSGSPRGNRIVTANANGDHPRVIAKGSTPSWGPRP